MVFGVLGVDLVQFGDLLDFFHLLVYYYHFLVDVVDVERQRVLHCLLQDQHQVVVDESCQDFQVLPEPVQNGGSNQSE